MDITLTRRAALLRMLFGPSMVGLTALATGIPAGILMHPRRALAASPKATGPAQYLIMSTSGTGDPLNCNVPGTYEDSNIMHPAAASMAPTQFSLGGKMVTAAAPWASLPAAVLSRTVFFHNATYTVVHGEESKTLTLEGAVANNDMLISALAAQTAPVLQTAQAEPILLGGTSTVTAQGRSQSLIAPSALAAVLASPQGALANLKSLRDQHVDRLNAYFRSQGTPAQQAFIDAYAHSRSEAQTLSQVLLDTLSRIQDDGPDAQISAAVALIRMNVAPAFVVGIPFGGDNHMDPGLAQEAAQTVSGVATLNNLMSQLAAANLSDRVTFCSLNVFGRSLSGAQGPVGRGPSGSHQCSVMIGKGLLGGVVGGVGPYGGDYGSRDIDSATGAPTNNGDIPFIELLSAMGKTLSAAVGVSDAVANGLITGGKKVQAVLA